MKKKSARAKEAVYTGDVQSKEAVLGEAPSTK